MKSYQPFCISSIENKLNIIPSSIHYKLTDDEFLCIINSVIAKLFGECEYNFILSSGTDNVLHILNTGDLIYKIYPNPTRNQIMHCSYYVTEFILNSLFGENRVVDCTTSYRSQNRLYINIYVTFLSNQGVDIRSTFDETEKTRYFNLNRQLEALELKRLEIFHDANKKKTV